MSISLPQGNSEALLTQPSFSRESLDPTLLQLALLVGILEANGDNISLNLGWFEDPLAYLQAIPTARRYDLLKTLQQLLGSSAGSAIGTPQSALNKLWYPIRYPGGDSPLEKQKLTGLYVVTTQADESNEGDDTVTVGLGILRPVLQESFTINPYVYFPLFELSKDKTQFGFGDNPAQLGVEINAPKSKPFGSGDLSFTGFKIASSIFFNGQPPELDLILLDLKMPGQEPADRSLQDLIDNTTVDQWLASGVSALAGLLAEIAPDEKVKKQVKAITGSMLNLLGLTGTLPQVDWQRLIKEPDQAKAIFLRWIQEIASSSAKLTELLNELFLLRNAFASTAEPESGNVTGAGTRKDPFAIEIIKVADKITVSFTVGTGFDDQNQLHVFPGLRVASASISPVTQVAVQIAASAEVADFTLGAAPQGRMTALPEPILFPSLSAVVVLANPNPDQPLFKVGSPDQLEHPHNLETGTSYLKVGTAMLGLTYDAVEHSGGARTLIPLLRLNDIDSTYGSWGSVDLTNYDQTMQLLSEGIAAFVAQKLQNFLGDRGGELAASLATVFGIVPPADYPGKWPVQDRMLLSPGQLGILIQNPLAALGSYYTRCLQAADGDAKPAFSYLLPSFAGLLGGVGDAVSGAGTASDPWRVEMATLGDNGPVAYLQAWQSVSVGNAQQALSFAINLSAELRVDQIIIKMTADLDLLETKLPNNDGSGVFGASWLAGVRAQLRLDGVDGPLKTRSTAGMNLQADYGLLAAGWNPSRGFHWLATLEGVAIKYTARPDPVKIGSGRLEFSSDTTEWSRDALAQFAPVILTVTGMAFLTNGGRVGLLLTCALGLLPSLPDVINGKPSPDDPFEIPPGLPLPAGWPTFNITDPTRFFVDPWPDLSKQIAALFSHGSPFATPMLRLIGWSLTGSVPADKTAAGTWDDPWLVRLESVWKLEVFVWSENGKTGFGLGRPFTEADVSGVKIAASIRAGLVYLKLASDAENDLPLPRVSMTCALSGNPLLVGTPESDLQVGKALLGAYLDYRGVFPIVTLFDAQLAPGQRFPVVKLEEVAGRAAFTSNVALQVMNVLIGSVMQRLSGPQSTELLSLLNLLVDLGIVDKIPAPSQIETTRYGINVGAWETLLANPPAFLSTRMNSVLRDDQQFAAFFNNLSTLMGIGLNLPPALKGMPDLLAALGLVERMAGGYTIKLSSWVRLVNGPVSYLNERLRELLNDAKVREQIISQFSTWMPPEPPLSKVRFSVTSGVNFKIYISHEDALDVGSGFRISGEAALDLQTLTFHARATIFSKIIGSALTFEYSVSDRTGGAWRLVIENAPGPLPAAFAPLQLYPLPQENLPGYFQELGLRLPLSILSALIEGALSRYVLPQYPVATNIFKALGLVEQAAADKPYQVKWLLRALFNPVDWILSPAVLGDGSGGMDLDKLGNALYTIPGPDGVVGPGGILLSRFETQDSRSRGMELTRLPYGAGLKMGADTQQGITVGIAAKPVDEISITGGMSFGVGNGVAVFGATKLDLAFGPVEDRRVLNIASSFESDQFLLTVTGKSGSFELPQITLLPFRGLSQYVPSGPQTAKLLDFIADESLKAYTKYKQSGSADPTLVKFVDAVIQFASYFDVKDAATLMATFDAIKSDPVKWVTGWFDPQRTAQTMTTLNDLLTNTFGLKGFSITDGQILRFAPPIASDIGSISIKMGNRSFDNRSIFGVWIEPVVKQLFLAARLEAGVGVETPIDLAGPVFRLTAESTLSADVRTFARLNIPLEPRLNFNIDVSTQTGIQKYGLNFFPTQTAADPDTLAITLLPEASLAYGNPPVRAHDPIRWMLDLALRLFVPLISNMALHTEQVRTWLNSSIGSSEVKPGAVLSEWGLLEAKGNQPDVEYLLADLKTAFDGLTFKQIVERLIYTALSSFPAEFKLLDSKNVALFIASKTENNVKRFGLGVSVTNLKVIGTDNSGKPQLLLQVGKWMSGDTDADSWFTRAGGDKKTRPGLLIYLVALDGGTLSFNARLEVISAGVDFKGGNQAPLLSLRGVQLGAIEPRLYFAIGMDAPGDFKLGGGIRIDRMGIPLGPGFVQDAGGSNPVAQNLLTSRAGQGEEPAREEAVNPSFSLNAGYVENFDLQFYQDDVSGEKTDEVWISVQRAFGPLQCRRVGVGWKGKPDNILSVLFDGKVSLAALALDMVNLSVGIPVTSLQSFDSYELDLAGLNVTFANGPVLISGGLLKTENPLAYTGQVVIKAQNFMIVGIGSYAELVGNPSMFVFAFTTLPIGGPPYFFVKGVAGGFGFNRGLRLPEVEYVHEFPLIKGLANPETFGDGTAKAGLEALARDIYPELGSYWLAAGLKFATFELLETTALLFIRFGKEFELSLLGLSILDLPKKAGPKSYVHAELALLVTLKPSEGFFAASARLTPNSYLIDKDCRLTGGFAFTVWFGGPHKGDFVLTIGGYHPIFSRPDHFPVVPRVGFRWPISGEVNAQGGAYFALTPSCVMAGGSLELTYKSGRLKAWFTAFANFLISWKPFYYDIELGVSIGASYEINLLITKTVTAELGAMVRIWGPRLRGKARISWWVISFTVNFGEGSDQRPKGNVIVWNEFYESFLPQPDKSGDSEQFLRSLPPLSAVSTPAAVTPQNIVQISAAQGLLEVEKDDNDSGKVKKGAPWVVRASAFKLATKTAIPATQIVLDNGGSQIVFKQGEAVGVRPMGSLSLVSTHTISIEYLSGAGSQKINLSDDWIWSADESGVSSALWDTVNDGYETPSAKVLEKRIVGIAAGSPKPKKVTGPPDIPVKNLAYLPLDPKRLPLSNHQQVLSDSEGDRTDSFKVIEDTIMRPDVVAFRREVTDAMAGFGINVEDGRLDLMAAYASSILDAEPMLGSPGRQQVRSETRAGVRIITNKPALPSAAPQKYASKAPRLVAVIRQYNNSAPEAGGARSGFSVRPMSSTSGRVHSLKGFSTREDWSSAEGVSPSASGNNKDAASGMSLHVGATVLWDMPDNVEGNYRLHFDGSMPVRVAAFDRNHGWLCCRELALSGPEDFEIPAETARLALTGLPQQQDAARQRVFGWHRRSLLIQVNPHANLGEGVIVWTRAPQRIEQGVLSLDHGTVYGENKVAANLARLADDALIMGWIETAVPDSVRTITVLLKREDDQPIIESELAQALEVSIPLNSTARVGERLALQARHVMIEGARANLFYSIPEEEAKSVNELISVLVRTEPGWVPQGVVGIEDEAHSANQRWDSITLKHAAAWPAEVSELKTEVEFIY